MTFIVGIMLAAFGIFWGAEGAWAEWPGGEAALLVVVSAVTLFALALVGVLRRLRNAPAPAGVEGAAQ